MRLASILVACGAEVAQRARQQWLVKVNETAPSDCRDTFSGFRETLNITQRLDLGGRIKSTVISHLLRKMLLPDWSEDNTEAVDQSYTADLLGTAAWVSDVLLVDDAAAADEQHPSQLYEHDKLMGRQTLSRLKEAIQAYFDSTGLISTIWHGATDRSDESSEELKASNQAADFYLKSAYANNLLDLVIGDASLHLFPNISLTVDSAMINLGDTLCKTTELTQDLMDQSQLDQFTCATHSLLEMGLTCNARDVQAPDCTSPATDQALICDIPEIGVQDPFAENFAIYPDIQATPNPNNIPVSQGNMDRWLLRAVSELYRYTKYDVICKKDQESTLRVLLPGWELVSDIWLDYSEIVNLNQTQSEAPFSLLLKKADSCDFTVVNRGSVFKSDWLIDFDYDLVELFYRPEDFNIGYNSTVELPSRNPESLGKLSKGYERIALETAKIIFYEILQTNCHEVNSIVFTGHSMGGIIGAAQALLMSSLYSTSHLPKLSLVSFAAPSAIDAKFKELIDQRATVRGWVIELDAVSKIPCKNALPNCHQLKNGISSQFVDRPRHEELPHTITIANSLLAKLMPTLGQKSFGTVSYNVFTGNLNLDSITFPGTTLFAQTHTCAYTCWMNAAYCSMTSAEEVCTACIDQ